VRDLESELKINRGEHIYGRRDIWPDLKRMYEGYIAEPSESARADGWRSTYAVVAYFAGKYDVAKEQLEALKWKPWPNSFYGWGADVSLVPEEVAARTSPLSREIAAAEASRLKGDFVKAIQALKELARAINVDERTAQLVRHRLAELE